MVEHLAKYRLRDVDAIPDAIPPSLSKALPYGLCGEWEYQRTRTAVVTSVYVS